MITIFFLIPLAIFAVASLFRVVHTHPAERDGERLVMKPPKAASPFAGVLLLAAVVAPAFAIRDSMTEVQFWLLICFWGSLVALTAFALATCLRTFAIITPTGIESHGLLGWRARVAWSELTRVTSNSVGQHRLHGASGAVVPVEMWLVGQRDLRERVMAHVSAESIETYFTPYD